METVIDATCSPSGVDKESKRANQVEQLSSLMRRQPHLYLEAASHAGLCITGHLTVQQMLQLKAITGMSWTLIRTIRSFLQHCGFDILASEKKTRMGAKELALEYDHGTVYWTKERKGKEPELLEVGWLSIKVAELWPTIIKWVQDMHRTGQLVWWSTQKRDTIEFVVGMDRGGRQTKIVVTFLNTRQPQASRSTLPIAFYEADEDHELLERLFGDIYRTLANPPAGFIIASTSPRGSLEPLWASDDFISSRCTVCKGCGQPSTKPWCPRTIAIQKVIRFYNGDTVGLHELLGTSGHSGNFFCPICTATKDTLVPPKGKQLHAFGHHKHLASAGVQPEEKQSSDFNSSPPVALIGRAPLRTLSGLRQAHEDFKVDPKHIAANHQNAVRRCIIQSEISGFVVPPVLHMQMV